jgi:XTP/dITP diphosphohydrolase
MSLRLVLASNNAKKLAELRDLLQPLDVHLVAQGDLGIAEADEPYGTFIENALTKARQAARAAGTAALADDSGLCVDALGGAPGVISAHYAALAPGQLSAETPREARRSLQDAANNALLLQRLQGQANRRAAFVSTLVALRSADDPQPLVAVGHWAGTILQAPRGSGGFGYDPLLYLPAQGASAAELDPATKNRVSHRALAAARMVGLMREVWGLG